MKSTGAWRRAGWKFLWEIWLAIYYVGGWNVTFEKIVASSFGQGKVIPELTSFNLNFTLLIW